MTLYKKLRNSAAALCLLTSGLVGTTTLSAEVHNTDVVILGSLCAGFDCVNGESFGFDTLRLKENNLRIHFQDTSATSSFPGNDWRIVINDSSNGGANFFGIEDTDAGRIPFRVEAGAPLNALYVEADGDVGIRTANPVVDLHIVDGNSPTIRLEQNGSSGFTPQTYDLAANEANFFIRDATNGSSLFFRAQPGAPQNSMFIAADGKVGLGTAAPSNQLHIVGKRIRLENTGATAALQLDESGSTNSAGFTLFNNKLVLAHDDGGTPEFLMDTDGNVRITGTLTTSGSCSSGCDAVFDDDYDMPTIEEHAELMFANKHLPVVGPTQSGPMNLSNKMTAMLNELEKAHIYIAQINDEKKELQARLQANEDRLAKLEALLEQ